jgi:hypothetical protein
MYRMHVSCSMAFTKGGAIPSLPKMNTFREARSHCRVVNLVRPVDNVKPSKLRWSHIIVKGEIDDVCQKETATLQMHPLDPQDMTISYVKNIF